MKFDINRISKFEKEGLPDEEQFELEIEGLQNEEPIQIPSAPPIIELENQQQVSINILENQQQMNYYHIKFIIYFLSIILGLSYIPGFLSITVERWQPSLATIDMYFTDGMSAMTFYCGWYKIYHFQEDNSALLNSINIYFNSSENFETAGKLYIIFSIISFFLLFTIFDLRKRHNVRFIIMLISWVMLLVVTITYIVNVNQYINEIDLFLNNYTEYDILYKIILGYGLICNFLGLLLIPVIHMLMYLS